MAKSIHPASTVKTSSMRQGGNPHAALAGNGVVKWGHAQKAGPTQCGDGKHHNHERSMLKRAGPHTGQKAFGAMKHSEDR